mgnify:FL=1
MSEFHRLNPVMPMSTRLLSWLFAVCCLLSLLIPLPTHAQSAWPSRTIRFVVPFAPGGSSEIIARAVAARLSESLGQSVYVENKPGGAGNIAMEEVKRAAPDGHTLILGHVGTLAVNPALFGAKLPYDPVKDFEPVALLASVPNVIAVNPALPVKSLADLVKLAKEKPGTLNSGTAGNGSAGHLAMEYFKMVSGIDIQHVPYRGTGPMLSDLLAGQTQITFNGVPPILGQIQTGKLRAIAVGSARRVVSLPDVPTVAESGYPGFETSQWYGVMVPARTPKAIIDRLHGEIVKALKNPAATQKIVESGGTVAESGPQQFATMIAREGERWAKVVKAGGITAD